VGQNVKRLKKGDQVFGFSSRLGTHAEYACLLEEGAAVKPANMSFEEAASVVQGALTALYFLRKGEIESGQKILIYGASGGVGSHAVQLAKHFGAEETGVCRGSKIDLVRSLGADKVIDYKKEDFTKTGETYDAIFDTVGKTPVSRSINALKEGGRYILATFGLPMLIKTLWLLRKSSKKAVFGLVEENSEELDFLRELIEAGELRAVIDRCYPIEEAAEAHKYVESGQKKGSVVVTMRQNGAS
jgi:NADPH:quinone reductase-like Zn-dependent oxidoreductase